MAVSAAVKYEVRWRVTGTAQWSDIGSCSPVGEIVVEGLDRTKSYDFEVRAVSACGARSAWGAASNSVPATDAPPAILTLTAQSLADGVHLAWTTATSPPAGIDYVLERASAPGGPFTLRDTYRATACTDPEPTGTLYYYRVAAVNYTGTYGAYSPVVNSNGKTVTNGADVTGQQTGIVVQNPIFANGMAGWTPGNPTGWYVQTGGANLPDPIVATAAVHNGGTPGASATDALYNAAHVPVVAGQQVTVTCCVNAVGTNAGAVGYARISWRNAANAEISTSQPDGSAQYPTSGAPGTGTYQQCVTKVIAAAPAGAQYAVAEPTVISHTAGFFLFSQVCMVAQPSSVDELPNGLNYGKTLLAGLVNGTIPLAGAGKSMIGNPTFIRNVQGVPIGAVALGSHACDNWLVSASDAQWVVYRETGDLLLRVNTGAVLANGATANAQFQSETFPVTPGQTLVCELNTSQSAGSTPPSGVSTNTFLSIHLTDASGNFLGGTNIVQIGRPGGALTRRASYVIPATFAGVAVAGAAAVVQGQLQNTSGASWTAGSLPYDMRITSCNVYSVQDLGTEVTGTLPNQSFIPNITFGSVRSLWSSGTTISASYSTATPSVVTFNVSAGSLYAGSRTYNYNAASGTQTQARGATQSYYLYYLDPNNAGGTQPLYISTTSPALAQNDNLIFIGSISVTVPSTGSGSGGTGGGGGGGGGGCVCTDQWIPGPIVSAGSVRRGDRILGTPERPRWLRWWFGQRFKVSRADWELQPCVRATTHTGASVSASTTTPMTLPDGSMKMLPEMLSELVYVRRYWLWIFPWSRWERVVHIEDLGVQWVNHISLGGNCYFAGDKRGVYINTHNMTIAVK